MYKKYNVSYDVSEHPFSDADFTCQGLKEYPKGQVFMELNAPNVCAFIAERFPHETINDHVWEKIHAAEYGFVQINLKAHRGDQAKHRAISFMEVES